MHTTPCIVASIPKKNLKDPRFFKEKLVFNLLMKQSIRSLLLPIIIHEHKNPKNAKIMVK